MRRQGIGVIALAVITTSLVIGAAPDAFAATGRVLAQPDLNLRAAPTGQSNLIGHIPYNSTIAIECTRTGTSVLGPYGSTRVWDRTTYNGVTGFVSDAWVYTGTSNAVAADCGTDAIPTPTTTPPVTSPPVTSPPVTSPPVTSPPSAPAPAQNTTPSASLRAPFPGAEVWYVCQGYNQPAITHNGSLKYSLDLVPDSRAAGPSGCRTQYANAAQQRPIVAPASGTLQLRSDYAVCISFDSGRSMYFTHLNRSSRRGPGRVNQGDTIGTVAPAGQAGNGGIAHLHVQAYTAAGCSGSSVPFEDARGTRFLCTPNMPDIGTKNMYSGRSVGTCTDLSGLQGHIVQWDGDGKAQKTAWFVMPDLTRQWIADVSTYNCLKGRGAPGPEVLSSKVLDSLRDQTNVRASC